jgi:ATPase subunit of ABC transporter with duplicated ATPase domains
VISLVNLGKHYGGRTLFEGVSLMLHAGCRYGLVGANGSGKTTLLNILCGDEPSSDGSIVIGKHLRLGVLRQDRFASDEARIVDVAQAGDAVVWSALQERERSSDPYRLAELDDVIVAGEGWSLRSRAATILEGLGIASSQHEQPLRTLSGGFKLRVLLAQVLAGRPDALLLDEPTNHLDILSIRWLEKFLATYAGCAIVISHDQRFLENVATDILDVDYGSITLYPLTFAKFLEEKELRRLQKEAEIDNSLEAIEHKRSFVLRFGAKATKASQAQSRMKQIEKLEAGLEELPESSRRTPLFRFEIAWPSGKDVLDINGISKAFGDTRVLDGVSLHVRRGERVAIVGPNGAGKSTLLKIATSAMHADAGTVTWGHEVQLGYFAQDHRDVLTRASDTPLTFLERASPDTATAFVRGHLGRVLFSGDDVKKSVHALSGGEAARLVLASIIVNKPNVLLLDEPTNHLDLEAIHALVAALRAFEGTLVFVSHDRWFVSQLAARIVEIRPSRGLNDFPGTWQEYLASCGDDHLDADAVSLKAKRERSAADGESAPSASHEDAKRRRGLKQSLEKKRDKILGDLATREARREEIRTMWCADGFYDGTPLLEQKKLTEEERALTSTIDQLVGAWERIEEVLSSL